MKSSAYSTSDRVIKNRALAYSKRRTWKLDMYFGNDRGGSGACSQRGRPRHWEHALTSGTLGNLSPKASRTVPLNTAKDHTREGC